MKPAFDQIATHYAPESGKLHITDLSREQQEAVRNELFTTIKDAGLLCFWYAIHVGGLHANHQMLVNLSKEFREKVLAIGDGAGPRIKGGSPRDKPKSMHVELFSKLFNHLAVFLKLHGQQGVKVEVRIDQVDDIFVKNIKKSAKEFLSDSRDPIKLKGFDTVEKKKVSQDYEIKITRPPELSFSGIVSDLNIKFCNDGLVLAADVLANSLNHLFTNRTKDTLYTSLNCKDAIVGHPLAACLNVLGESDLIDDVIYRHPKAST
ncbi:MAG: hypothetical protein LBV45_11150 [Xanthomonadaceae bacterium]|nr:hypothetical protein [Xanthomonadaceae bacterium]